MCIKVKLINRHNCYQFKQIKAKISFKACNPTVDLGDLVPYFSRPWATGTPLRRPYSLTLKHSGDDHKPCHCAVLEEIRAAPPSSFNPTRRALLISGIWELLTSSSNWKSTRQEPWDWIGILHRQWPHRCCGKMAIEKKIGMYSSGS